MRIQAWILVVTCVLLITGPSMAGDQATELKSLVRGSSALPAIAGLAVVTQAPGEAPFEFYAGLRRIAPDDSLPIDRNTRFRVASISKLVVAIGFMRLVEAGRIGLDDDVSVHLGFELRHPAHPDVAITSRMLLAHTSGIRDGELYYMPPGRHLREFFEPGSDYYEGGAHFAGTVNGAVARPGEWFEYSNLNFGVLGTLIERISGQRFDLYMQAEVLGPLGIDGGFNPSGLSEKSLRNLSVLYRSIDGAWVAQVDDYPGPPPEVVPASTYEVGSNGTPYSPQGGLRISAIDLAKIGRLMVNRGEFNGIRLLEPESVALMESPVWTYDPDQPNGDTLDGLFLQFGLSVHSLTGGSDKPYQGFSPPMYGHMGEAYGLLSALLYRPDSGEVWVYVINGTPQDLSTHGGKYSSFYRWEEEILSALGDAARR